MHIHKINGKQTWQGEQPNALKLKNQPPKRKPKTPGAEQSQNNDNSYYYSQL